LLFDPLAAELRMAPWVVHAKRPFGGPARFRWRDYADGDDRPKVLALSAEEFLRRFLLHVVPHGFVRIRYFGRLANRRRRATLDRCRAVLAEPTPAALAPRPLDNDPGPHAPTSTAVPTVAAASCA
jgi:Putative transposase